MSRRMSRRARQRRALLREMIRRDGPDCAWCGEPLGDDMDALEADHVIPASQVGRRIRLGRHALDHFQALHAGCNLAKGPRGVPGTVRLPGIPPGPPGPSRSE